MLEEIIAHKRGEVARRRSVRPLAVHQAPPSDRRLSDVLRRGHTGFILECKKASPSKGLIRKDFDPAAIARAYAPFADAVSVLTDERFFQGSLDFLSIVRAETTAPVLCKDFIVDPYQIVEARLAGADAVLLMMSVLDDAALAECLQVARQLHMDALVEVHDENELRRALHTDAPIIGINNRSFADLRVDVAVTQRLAPLVPRDRLVVSESGILHHDHVRRLRPLVDGFLVGSALMEQENLTAACGELMYGRVKVCGLTRRDDALAAAAAGVQFGGLIFAKKSPRYLDIRDAQEVCRDVPLRFVGVFADAPPSVVADTANHLGLYAVQLHGMENRDYLYELKQVLAKGVEVWTAVAVGDALPSLAEFDGCRMLLDAGSGGSGAPFDWGLLDRANVKEMVLAGGLNARNGARADDLGAFALDVNSGIESAPGQKDTNQLNAFLAALRGTGRSHT